VRKRRAALDRALEGLVARDDVVGRRDQQHGVIRRDRVHRGERQGGRRAAAFGLEQNRLWTRPDALELLCHHEAMRLVADDERLDRAVQASTARPGFLQQGLIAVQGVQRLGMVLARKRPQPRAGSSA
jgi:hypothetical protein